MIDDPLPPLQVCTDVDPRGCQCAVAIHDPDTGCMVCGCRRLIDPDRLRSQS